MRNSYRRVATIERWVNRLLGKPVAWTLFGVLATAHLGLRLVRGTWGLVFSR